MLVFSSSICKKVADRPRNYLAFLSWRNLLRVEQSYRKKMEVEERICMKHFSCSHLGPPVKLADDEPLLGVHLQVEPPHEAVQVQQVVGGLVARPLHLPRHPEQQREAGVHLRRHCLQFEQYISSSLSQKNVPL